MVQSTDKMHIIQLLGLKIVSISKAGCEMLFFMLVGGTALQNTNLQAEREQVV